MFVSSLTHEAAALRALDRHQERRRQGVPTLTVLAADRPTAEMLVDRWAKRERRRVCQARGVNIAGALERWFEHLAESTNIAATAFGWLAKRAGDDFSFGLAARSHHEQTLFLDRVLGASTTDPAAVVCRAIVEHACRNGSAMQGLWPRLLDRFMGDRAEALTGVVAIIDDHRLPVLHVAIGTLPSTSLATLVAELTSLAALVPALVIIVSADEAVIEELLDAAPESRGLALVREGLVDRAGEWSVGCDPTQRFPTDSPPRALRAQMKAREMVTMPAKRRWKIC